MFGWSMQWDGGFIEGRKDCDFTGDRGAELDPTEDAALKISSLVIGAFSLLDLAL